MDKNRFKEEIYSYILTNNGKIIGAILGFIFGILLLFLGFFKTLLIFITTLVGYFVGSHWDIEGDLRKLLDKILPPQLK